MAVFISFEGGEGSGKSTQAKVLFDKLITAGALPTYLREPGGTELGDYYVRDLIKSGLPREGIISDEAELFLFSAARADLVAKTLLPKLAHSEVVIVADRYVDSTTAYQGHGRGIPLEQVKVVNALATQGVMPNLTFLLDLAPVDGLMRINDGLQLGFRMGDSVSYANNERVEEGRRIEDEPLEFHERVRSGYLELAASEPERFCVIDAALPEGRVSELIWYEVCDRFPELVAVMESAD